MSAPQASASSIRIGLTAGCPAGVGPELLVRGLLDIAEPGPVHWVFFGSPNALSLGAERAGVAVQVMGDRVHLLGPERACIVECRAENIAAPPLWDHQISEGALAFQRDALVAACRAGARGELDALFTGPIRKSALQNVGGISFPGQTELCHSFLAKDARPPLMCFTGGPFVLALATVHVPLRDVAGRLSTEGVLHALERLAQAATAVRGSSHLQTTPSRIRLSVLGLNPHAGEGGLLGQEENQLLIPALQAFHDPNVEVNGPIPADGFFAHLHRLPPEKIPDGVLAMFHDQGLCGYKAICQGQGVNLTWGLKIPRTSPDHGTADDLRGTGHADPASTLAALRLAMQLARQT